MGALHETSKEWDEVPGSVLSAVLVGREKIGILGLVRLLPLSLGVSEHSMKSWVPKGQRAGAGIAVDLGEQQLLC